MFINPKIKIINVDDKMENFYCTICNFPLTTHNDFKSDQDFCCCYECYLNFVEARKDKWKKGWRPKQEEIDTYVKDKKNLYENN